MVRALRSEVFESDAIGVYHCYNRIVRRSFLCGADPLTGKDYSHRREWLYRRLRYLAKYFAIDVLGYAILSNHFHLVLRNRPDQVEAMSDVQVVRAWLMICPSSRTKCRRNETEPSDAEVRIELHRPGRIRELRQRLANPSWLIRQLSQYMGIRCNAEDQIRGHFWESRFGMRRLLDEAAVLACLAYVDLNPIRASMVDSLEEYSHVSIGERLRTIDDQSIDASNWLAPLELAGQCAGKVGRVMNRMSREELAESLASESAQSLGSVPMRLEDYANLLRWLAQKQAVNVTHETIAAAPPILGLLQLDPEEFAETAIQFGVRFSTAAGCSASLAAEAKRRGRHRIRGPNKELLNRSVKTA